MTDIKNCPFCGGNGHVLQDNHPRYFHDYEGYNIIQVKCLSCTAKGHYFPLKLKPRMFEDNKNEYKDYVDVQTQKAIEAWNRRIT